MNPIGYYVTCDDAVCDECAPAGFAESDYSEWDGFESWDEPIAIFSDTESDTPTHCTKCEALIPHALTGDGYLYVEEAARDNINGAIDEHSTTPDVHSLGVVELWLEQYADWGEMNGYLVALHSALLHEVIENEGDESSPENG